MKGRFITLEGIDGAGKSSALPLIERVIRSHRFDVLLTREPGGTKVGEQLRELLLRDAMRPETEALIVFAARQEHLCTVIRPALDAGKWVLCDRFTDATMAYQGAGRGIPIERLAVLEQWVQRGLEPDLTLLFDLPAAIASERTGSARPPDRIESEQTHFFERVRQGYLHRAAAASGRVVVIDSGLARASVEQEVARVVELFIHNIIML